jgi:PAS domain S-box-containing protein
MNKAPVILAIDDYRDNLITVKAFVSDAFPGAVVYTTDNGTEGIELARKHDPDLILLDIVMPGMDGFEVCRIIKEDPRLRTIPVIFLTALKDDRESRIRALEAGGEAFITKPFEDTEFTAQIRAMIKIKAANERELREKENLADLVAERTLQLEKELAERKKVEEELRQANLVLTQNRAAMLNILADLKDEAESRKQINELLKNVLLNLDAVIFSTDQNGVILVSEGKALSSIGLVPGEAVGKSVFQEYRDYPEVISMLRTALSGSSWSGSISFGNFVFDANIQPVYDTNGEVCGAVGVATDGTEKKKTTDALRKSEERYRRIIDAAEEGIWEMNGDMVTVYVNPRMAEMLGYTPEEMLGRDVSTFMIPEDLDNHHSLMKKRRAGENDRYERRFIRKDGKIAWMLVSATALVDENGGFNGSFAMFSDITDHKEYEERLLRSEENYREIFNSTSEAIMIDDAETGAILDVNETTLRMYGYSSKDEILAGNIGDLSADIPPYTEKEAQKLIQNTLTEGPQVFEWLAKKRSGEPFLVEVSLRKSDIGGKGKILAVVRDIGDRKRAEKRLEESERRYRSVVENASEGIAVIKEGIVSYANPRGCEMIQLPPDEIIGRPFISFIHPDDQAVILDRYTRRVSGEDVLSSYDLRLVGRKGLVTWVQVSVIRIIWEEQVATLNFLINITDRKSAEDALRESNQKLRLLTSLTRHDILNHLTTIRLCLDLAREAEDRDAVMEYLSKASTTSELVETVIGFTRQYEMFGIAGSEWQPVYRIIESARRELSHAGISISNLVPTNLEIYADPIIQKVFSTLLDNAARHGGTVTQIRFFITEEARSLNIICEDNGTGIQVDEKERIFEHGYGKNTGIGLFLARAILGITGLSISEEGKPGYGAKFTILVPESRFRFSGEKPVAT